MALGVTVRLQNWLSHLGGRISHWQIHSDSNDHSAFTLTHKMMFVLMGKYIYIYIRESSEKIALLVDAFKCLKTFFYKSCICCSVPVLSWIPKTRSTYESFSDVGESRVWWRADFQSGSRVLKKVF